MRTTRTSDRNATAALAAAGILWGLTVPLSKLALAWLAPAPLTFARFALAAPLLAIAGRRGLRAAARPSVALAGAIGFGAVIALQNAGIARTSVSHAAVVVGTVPVLVALLSATAGRSAGGITRWGGYALALGGIVLVAGSRGAGASPRGDLFVLASAALSAAFIVIQPRLLHGRDAAAVTAVQFAGAALLAGPLMLVSGGIPTAAPPPLAPLLAVIALVAVGTVLPFWLFAFGQARVPADLAGAYVNLEPVVGALVGWTVLGDHATSWQLSGALAVVAGVVLSTAPAGSLRSRRRLRRGMARVG